MASSKPSKNNRVCHVCKSAFYAKPSRISEGGGLYCSKKCYSAWKGAPLHERFYRHVGSKNENGCILWNGACNPQGYGVIYGDNKRKALAAHRVAWEIKNGSIPDNLFVLHKCDVPGCVNDEHLILGTCKDNMVDASSKGRMAKGERHWKSKVSSKQIHEIRALKGKLSRIKIGLKFGISHNQVSRIIRRENWKHIN